MDPIPLQPQKHPQSLTSSPSIYSNRTEEPDVCRVCRVEGDENDPLIYPCKCSGSVRYVHPDCLKSWLAHSHKRYCEICGHRYTFTKVYPERIPDVIPLTVYFRQSLRWLLSLSKSILRFCLVVFVWLIMLPSLNMVSLRSLLWLADTIVRPSTTVVHPGYESRADAEIGAEAVGYSLKSAISAQNNTLVGFVFRGQILSLATAGVILCLILVREWIHRHDLTEHLQAPLHEQGEIRPDEWVVKRGVAIKRSDVVAYGPLPAFDRLVSENVEEGNDQPRSLGPTPMDVAFTPPELLAHTDPAQNVTPRPDGAADQEGDNAAFMELLRALDVDAPQHDEMPVQPANLEPEAVRAVPEQADHVAWDDAEDGNWEREDWDGIFEVVGLIGPISNLFQNAILAMIILGATLTVLIGTPMITGKLALSLDILQTAYLGLRVCYRIARKVTDPVVDVCFEIVQEAIALPLSTSFIALERILHQQLRMPEAGGGGRELESSIISPEYLNHLWESFSQLYNHRRNWASKTAMSTSIIDRISCLLVGYAVGGLTIACIVLAGEASTSRLSSGIREAMGQYGKFLKLAFFMALEMALFPIVAGTAINICLIPLFQGTTLATRKEQLMSSPFALVFVNWLLGTSFMYAFSALLSHIRSILRPGTIFFIRDPTDASFSPVKDILERGTASQLRKLFASALMYCIIIISLFGCFTWTLKFQPVVPIVPLRIKGQAPWSPVPFDLLFVHLVVPPTIRAVRPRSKAKKLLNTYWRLASGWFGLTPLMYGHARRATVQKNLRGAWVLERVWPILDPFFQLVFGLYDKNATNARVPATDRVALLSQAERREHGVFIPLDESGSPRTERAKLALLKQDRVAREKGRSPRDDYQIIWLPAFWRTRIHVFILTALVVSSWSVALGFYGPLVIGRATSGLLGLAACHDGYNYMLGLYICLAATRVGRSVGRRISRFAYAKRLRRSDSSVRFKRTILGAVSACCTLFTAYTLVPLLLGMNLEMYVSVPVRYGIRAENPVIHVWDAWANGTILVSLLTGIMRERPPRRGRRGPVQASWHSVLQIYRTPMKISFRQLVEAIGPAIIALAFCLCFPGLVVVFMLWASSHTWRAAIIFRVVYPASFCFLSIVLLRLALGPRIESIRQKMIEFEFVVEERVENYVPERTAPDVEEKTNEIDEDDWVDEEE